MKGRPIKEFSLVMDLSQAKKGADKMGYMKDLRKRVGTRPLILPASVVIILNEQDEILLQKRLNGRWGLPGGLMELGESFEETAKREILEETGLTIRNITFLDVFSGKDLYVKVDNGDEFYAVTALFMTRDVAGSIQMDPRESLDLQYIALDQFPPNVTRTSRIFLDRFMELK
ncbi:NUDIX hydrolase [Halalkalibacterium halodurans]|jgi:8-oxo-dGTP pyrophosphatase MutT (NUDIX family)|nr:NUDIX hydrolase [Halalkalibacterium halodurans]